MTRRRAVVLASGGGSNLQALLDYLAALGESRAADVVLVASDQPGARALDRARDAGIPTALIASPRTPEGRALGEILNGAEADLIVLAGYLRLVPEEVTARYAGRMLNVHPGPLPRFGGAGMYGARVHRAVLAAGAPLSGPTVHLVDAIYDHGAPLAHWPVPVLADDDEPRLAARVLRAEHLLFPRVVQLVAGETWDDDSPGSPAASCRVLPTFDERLDDATLARIVDDTLCRSP